MVLINLLSQDVCSGKSGHAEVVLLEYDPDVVAYEELLEIFWKTHDPTQVSDALYCFTWSYRYCRDFA